MTDERTPEGIDPALWAEFQRLFDLVHELHRQREIEIVTPGTPTPRMVLNVPEEWFLLFAWIDNRERHWRRGENGETGLTPERIGLYERSMRKAVSGYLWRGFEQPFSRRAARAGERRKCLGAAHPAAFAGRTPQGRY